MDADKTYLVVMQVNTDYEPVIVRKTEKEIRELAKTVSKYDYCVINGSVIKSFDTELPEPWFHMMQSN